jgi:hypothetical protein
MNNLFLSYELALIAKEKGFNEPCLACYRNTNAEPVLRGCGALLFEVDRMYINSLNEEGVLAVPLYQQIIDWFREKYNLDIVPQYCMQYPLDKKLRQVGYGGNIYNHKKDINVKSYFGTTYYEALNFAIQEAFKLI